MRTGVDIVKNSRIKHIMDKKRDSFYRRVFTIREIEYISNKNHDYKTVAGLFAAKEAISKVFESGIGVLSWKDIEILHKEKGKPYVELNSKAKDLLSEIDLNAIDVSISHEDEFSVAFAIGYKK